MEKTQSIAQARESIMFFVILYQSTAFAYSTFTAPCHCKMETFFKALDNEELLQKDWLFSKQLFHCEKKQVSKVIYLT